MNERSPDEASGAAPALEDALLQRRRRDVVVLRILVFLDIGMFILGFFLGVNSSSPAEGSEVQPLVLGVMGLLVFATFASWQSLARLKPWGASLYTASYLSTMLLGFVFFETSWEKTRFESVVDWFTVGISFSVMVMAHFSCALLRPVDSR